MKSFAAIALLSILVMADAATAQESSLPRPEIGFRGGLSIFHDEGETFNVLSFPGSSILGVATAHATMFVGPTLALEPQFGIVRTASGSNSSGQVTVGLQLNQFSASPSAGAPFGFLNGGFISGFSDSGSGDTIYAVGGGAGYRTVAWQTLGVRFEARYRRFFGDEGAGMNEFSLLIGLGAILGDAN